MRPLWALVIYIVVVFFGGALLAPWLYWLAQHFAIPFPNLPAPRFIGSWTVPFWFLPWPECGRCCARSARNHCAKPASFRPTASRKNCPAASCSVSFHWQSSQELFCFLAGVCWRQMLRPEKSSARFWARRVRRRWSPRSRKSCSGAACSAGCAACFTGRWRWG